MFFLSLSPAGFRAIAADLLSASAVTWKQHFGSSTEDTNTLFSLMAHGYFRAASTNIQSVVSDWLKIHPKAVVVFVVKGGPVIAGRVSPRFAYVWVVQDEDNLNVELVRRGCFAPETQILNPNEKADVPKEEYDAFVLKVTKAGESAKHERLGIWGS